MKDSYGQADAALDQIPGIDAKDFGRTANLQGKVADGVKRHLDLQVQNLADLKIVASPQVNAFVVHVTRSADNRNGVCALHVALSHSDGGGERLSDELASVCRGPPESHRPGFLKAWAKIEWIPWEPGRNKKRSDSAGNLTFPNRVTQVFA